MLKFYPITNMIKFFLSLATIQNNPTADTWCQSLMFYKLKTFPVRNVRRQLSQWNFSRVAIIKIILLIVNTVPHVFHCCYCFQGKCCSCFECLLSCITLRTVMHYQQKPYVRNVTGLHRTKNRLKKNSVSSQCTHGKSSLVWRLEVHPKCFQW